MAPQKSGHLTLRLWFAVLVVPESKRVVSFKLNSLHVLFCRLFLRLLPSFRHRIQLCILYQIELLDWVYCQRFQVACSFLFQPSVQVIIFQTMPSGNLDEFCRLFSEDWASCIVFVADITLCRMLKPKICSLRSHLDLQLYRCTVASIGILWCIFQAYVLYL